MAALTGRRVTAGGRSKFTVDGVLIHRRLDRTPEPADKFRRLAPENKERIYDLRDAVENTHLKMSRLEEDLDEKQEAMEKEKAMREAAEKQLQENLVDMYGNEAVNEELRQRLPRSSPSSTRRKGSLSPKYSGHRVSESPSVGSPLFQGPDSDIDSRVKFRDPGDARRSLDFAGSLRRRSRKDRMRGRKNFSSDEDSDTDIPVREQRIGAQSETHQHTQSKTNVDVGRGTMTSTPLSLVNSSTSATFVSPLMTMVMAPVSYVPQATTLSSQTAVLSVPSASTSGVSQPSQPALSSSMGGLNNRTSPVLMTMPSMTPQHMGPHSAQQVAYLLEELQLTRENNTKLAEKLTKCEEELESTKRVLHFKEVEKDADLTSQVAAVIEEIHQSQEEREASILGRLKLANEERDSLYNRLVHYGALPDENEETRQSPDEEGDISSDEFLELDIEQLLSRVGTYSSPSLIEKTADHVTALIAATHKRREEVIAEEMQIVLEERDVALAKCQRLEKQVIQLERKGNPYSLHPSPERALQAQLGKAHQELNNSQCKVQDLEEELQTLRIYHSVRKDVLTSTELNNTVDLYEVQLQEKDSRVSFVQKENNILLSQLRSTVSELEKTRGSLLESQKNKEKLERLVKVLKRKINTASTPGAV